MTLVLHELLGDLQCPWHAAGTLGKLSAPWLDDIFVRKSKAGVICQGLSQNLCITPQHLCLGSTGTGGHTNTCLFFFTGFWPSTSKPDPASTGKYYFY